MQRLQVTYSTWKQVTGLPVYYVTQNEGYSIFACGDQYFVSSEVIIVDDILDFENNYKASATEASSKDDAFVLGMIVNNMRLSGTQPALEPDKRMVVVNFPADSDTQMWLAGAGDDIENQVRGEGPEIIMEFADVVREEPEIQHLDIQFLEWVQLHDGQVIVTTPSQWYIRDKWNWGIHLTESEVTLNETNEGNCNVVNSQGEPGQPDSVIVVPAAGDGAYDVDLSVAVPVPANGQGFWRYDYATDTLEPSATPGQASYHILLIPVTAYFMRTVTIPCHPAGNFDFDAYKAERIFKRWKLRLTVKKVSNGPGALSGWVVVFREYNT